MPLISLAFRRVLRNSVTQLLPSGYRLYETGKAIEVRVRAVGGTSTR